MGDAVERRDDEAAAARRRGVPALHDGARGPGLKRLVVNGDDFGFSRGVNRAIAEAHDRGILTSASLMVTGEAAAEAVDLARSRPALAVGLHLVLVRGRPASRPEDVPSLLGAGGVFSGSPFRAGLKYRFSSRARVELRHEIRAQLEAFRRTGLPLSHVDGHLHLHVHPAVLAILRDLASEFRIPAVRLPSEELSATVAVDPAGLAGKIVHAAVFRPLRRHGEKRMREGGIAVADRVYGLLQTGRIDERYLLGLLPRIRAARVELYCHPAHELAGEPRNGPPGAGPAELAALVSPRVREAVAANGFRLTTPAGLFGEPAPALAR